MSLRRAIVEALPSEINVAEFCRCHGASTWFFYNLRKRHELLGDVVLEPMSRAPHHPAGKTAADVEDAIVAKRKELDNEGLDGGAASIASYLAALPGLPSESTIWRILTARGLITAQPNKAPKSGRSWTAALANECWALDDTDWILADGTPVKILNTLDDHSRYCVTSTAMSNCTGASTLAALAGAAVFLGWPERFWSDNAKAFRLTLAAALAPIGVASSHSRPYHPQSNGKIERFHQTMQKWLVRRPLAATIEELQDQLEQFRVVYNTQRPHRSLDRRFPADVWTTAPKTGPIIRALGTPTTVYDTVVHDSRCYAGPYAITVGVAHNHKRALTIITGTACHVFVDGHLIRHLTLTLGRRSQPLKPPRQSTTLTVREDPRHA